MSYQGDDDLFSGRRGPRGDHRNDRRSVNVKGSSQGSSDQGSEAKCFAAAVRLLAGREYSVKELSAKLLRRFSADAVANVVAEMQAEGYVCNTRYGEAFCRSRVARGYGPVFIARELEQNGLDSDLIDALLQPHEDRWLEYAIAQVEKKASRGPWMLSFLLAQWRIPTNGPHEAVAVHQLSPNPVRFAPTRER